MLYLYYINGEDEGFVERARPFLASQRIERLDRYKFTSDRVNCALVYLLLRYGLKKEYGITEPPVFGFHKKEKPFLNEHPDIHFNMSHCAGAAACIISDRSTAVDVTGLRKVEPRLYDRVCSHDEAEAVRASDDPRGAFLRLWTRKECCTKLSGLGFSADFRTVTDSLPEMEHIHTFEQDGIICSYFGDNVKTAVLTEEELFGMICAEK